MRPARRIRHARRRAIRLLDQLQLAAAGLANPVVRFWCNYDTETRGIARDRRTLQVRSGDGATPLGEYQLASTGYSFDPAGGPTGGGPGPCGGAYVDIETLGPVSAWHQHTVRLEPAWGNVRIRFAFDAVDDERNGYAGWAIDDFAVESHPSPPLPGWPDMLPETTSVDGDGNELDTCERRGSFLRWSWGATNAGDEDVHLIVGNHPDAILDQTHLFYHAEHSHYHMSQYSNPFPPSTAPVTITSATTGTFRPEQALSTLSGRSGSAVNGNWRLVVSDNEGLDVGTIQCWTLEVTPQGCTPGSGACP